MHVLVIDISQVGTSWQRVISNLTDSYEIVAVRAAYARQSLAAAVRDLREPILKFGEEMSKLQKFRAQQRAYRELVAARYRVEGCPAGPPAPRASSKEIRWLQLTQRRRS